MTEVWEHSAAKGSDLLLLLAIADHAHDNGTNAYPSIDSLAKKTRLSRRQVQYNIRNLVSLGELEVQDKQGPHGVNMYRITFNWGAQSLHGATDSMVQSSTDQGATGCATPTQGSAPKPSVIINEPSHKAKGKKPLPENGPVQQIIKSYCDAVGIEQPVSYTKAAGQAKTLARAGITAEDIPHIVTWLRSQTWIKSGIDLGLIVSQAEKWRTANPRRQPVKPLSEMTEREKIVAELQSYRDNPMKGFGAERVREPARLLRELADLDEQENKA